MRELSLNVLDIAQNSLSAGASLVEIGVAEDTGQDLLVLTVRDNGWGMTPAQQAAVRDPFYTTRTTRRVGMGVPLFRMAAEMAGGGLDIASVPGEGTVVTARFVRSHIDRMPVGDMCGTVTALIRMNPQVNFLYRRRFNSREMAVDTRELRQVLGEEVPLSDPDVMEWITAYIQEQEDSLTEKAGPQTDADRSR